MTTTSTPNLPRLLTTEQICDAGRELGELARAEGKRVALSGRSAAIFYGGAMGCEAVEAICGYPMLAALPLTRLPALSRETTGTVGSTVRTTTPSGGIPLLVAAYGESPAPGEYVRSLQRLHAAALDALVEVEGVPVLTAEHVALGMFAVRGVSRHDLASLLAAGRVAQTLTLTLAEDLLGYYAARHLEEIWPEPSEP